jgi:hypothetical protein
MKVVQGLSLALLACCGLAISASKASAQVGIGVQIGPPPVCPYGYYEAPPYNCAPDGYYGPEWFNGGVFIGAGPWYHGPDHFYGHVDHHFDYRHGYHGAFPARGEAPAPQRREFHGNAMHDVHGNEHRGK